uniref:Uncharacterized protein n=1 Tax=Arundo donax TaxID=35708 RepID=A0A0A9D5A0_ARUDO
MGDTRPRAGGGDESPRDPKAPRLDLLTAVAAGSGRGDPPLDLLAAVAAGSGPGEPPLDLLAAVAAGSGLAEAPPLEVSNLREERAEGIGNDNMCAHVPTDSAHKEILSSSLLSEDAGTCEGCWREESGKCRMENSSILVCLECGRHFCSGLGDVDYPFGHSRQHAMKKQHWVAAFFDDPEKGYCFKCNVEVDVTPEEMQMIGKVEAGGHVFGLTDVAGDFIGGLPSLRGTWYTHGFGLADGQGYAIKGIPNRGNTCYVNAMVQCLLVLDKLRARMLGLDAPKGLLAMILGELFVETCAEGDMLDPDKLLTCARSHDDMYERGMHDSYQLLGSLREALNEDEEKYKNLNGQNGAPRVTNSIFGFELSETRTCECRLCSSVSHPFFYDLSLPLPSRVHLARSAVSPQTSESLKSQPEKTALQSLPANEHSTSEKIKTVAKSGDSHLPGSELKDVAVEETPEPLEVGEFICSFTSSKAMTADVVGVLES